MKKKNIKIIAIAIMSLVILAGIVVVGIFGFNKELRYGQGQVINVYVEQMVDVTNIKKLVNECLAGKTNMVQTVEIYQDYVTIKAKEITEEQKNNIVNKLKENYEFSQTAEDTTIENVAATKYIDIYKKYIVPFAVSGVIVLAYIVIRYHKKGILKVLGRTIIIPVFGELFLLSVIAITRIPVGRYTPVLVIAMYITSIMMVIRENEK
ncbi:protein translocase subunit SecF [Clostridium sp. CAG:356]|nr:MAG: hypothetical protein BHW02_03110 [Clostridium sp. 28_12]CDD37417.1 protein translocase subunit SecF [Clostridium sp. CAG:356]